MRDLQVAFNGELGSSRDASVYGDGAKPKIPGQWARASGRKSSLRMAIQIGLEDRAAYGVRDWRQFSGQTERSGERVLLTSFS